MRLTRLATGLLLVYAGVYVAYLAWVFWPGQERILGGDFPAFYTAGKLAAEGQAGLAYSLDGFQECLRDLFGAGVPLLPWHYPPVILLGLAGLSSLPYALALYVWLGLNLGGLIWVLRLACGVSAGFWFALCYPGLLVNLFSAQNGFLTAAILGGGIWAGQRRPVLGGAIWGLLCFKPQFFPLLPFALWAQGNRRALCGLFASAALVCLWSGYVFGWQAWLGFIADLGQASELLASGRIYWPRLPTVYAAARLLGAGNAQALTAQLAAAGLAFWAVYELWREERDLAERTLGLGLAVLLCSAHSYAYDLALLAPGLGLWFNKAWNGRGRLPERAAIVLLWVLPFAATALAEETRLQIGPWLFMLALWIIQRKQSLPESGHE